VIDKPYVIDRETVKLLLQITDTTYDSLIDLYLPIVSEDVELICNQSFVCEYTGSLTNASNDITNININMVSKGWLVSTEQYAQSLITDSDISNKTITVDEVAVATLDDATILVNQFPIAKRIAISQMIAYQIGKNKGISSASNGSVKSKSLPPLSVTYNSDDNAILNGYGYPQYIVNSLKAITKPRFI
jgi:hypothetical protein